MRKTPIYISRSDLHRLQRLLTTTGLLSGRDGQNRRELKAELDRAVVLPPGDIPFNVVTMYSRFRLKDPATGRTSDFTLRYPSEMGRSRDEMSVLSPSGIALLGRQAGDVVEWDGLTGVERVQVDRILRKPTTAPERSERPATYAF